VTAKSIHGNSPEEIRLALEQSLSDDFTPTLAIVFISIKQDRKAVSTMLDKMGIDVIGATSAGEFTDGHQSEGASVIMLLDIPKEEYSIFFETIGDGSSEVTARQLRSCPSPIQPSCHHLLQHIPLCRRDCDRR